MSPTAHKSYGRIVMLLVLSVLVLTVCAAVCVFIVQESQHPIRVGGISSIGEAERLETDYQRKAVLLTILLISSLLILLYVVGAYLVIHAGRMVARDPIGGSPTNYVDAWGSYRLTDEQISAATSEHQRDEDGGGRSDKPNGPPPGPRPDKPPSEN